MGKLNNVFSTLIFIFLLLWSNCTEGQVIRPQARGTPNQGPTIDEAQKEDAMGRKARVAVTRFENKSAKGGGEIGTGMAEMLAHALFATNRFIVLERQALSDVIDEQNRGASGRFKIDTAAKIGEIEGADILVQGTITEFEPGTSGVDGRRSGSFRGPRGFIGPFMGDFGEVMGNISAGIKISHVAMIIKMIDAKTSRILASEQVEGRAKDISGMADFGGGVMSACFSGFSNTPMEKAIRIAIGEAVRLIVAKTPAEYFRPEVKHKPKEIITSNSATTLQPSSQKSLSHSTQINAPKVVYVSWPKVSLREGPGTQYRILGELSKGTCLEVIGEQGPWLKVRIEDGKEGWVGKATISENP